MNFDRIERKQKLPEKQETERDGGRDNSKEAMNLAELAGERQESKVEVEEKIEKIRQDIADRLSHGDEESNIISQEAPAQVPGRKGLLDRLRNNKWIKRLTYASLLSGSLLMPDKLTAQTEKEALSGNRIELATDSASRQRTQAEQLRDFSAVIDRLIAYTESNPDESFLEIWDFGAGKQYYNKETVANKPEDNQSAGQPQYEMSVTKDTDGKLKNFDFWQTEGPVQTIVRYNNMFSEDIIALRMSYERQPGFTKISGRQFENKYGIVITRPGFREDMGNHFIWVDEKIDENKTINDFIQDFSQNYQFSEDADKLPVSE